MLTPILNKAIPAYFAAQKSERPSFFSLPLEIQQEIEDLLDFSGRQTLFRALTTVTRCGEAVEEPAVKLRLIKNRIKEKYQRALVNADGELHTFAFNQLEKLSALGKLDEVIEKNEFCELLWFIDKPEILEFLQEKIKKNPELEQKLWNWVERSRLEEVQIKAAHAITFLGKAGVQFNNKDLKAIRVPGADLSYGVFDSAQLQGADLRGVNFHQTWLRQANLSRAQMSGVQFGELAYLQEESNVTSCAYSLDGKIFAVGLGNGNISVYTTLNWEKVRTLEGHTNPVWSVTYSPDGSQIASGSDDETVRVWDAQSGTVVYVLEGHTDPVWSVTYSPDGSQIASGSVDYTIRLWNTQSGMAVSTLEGHTSSVLSLAYSPNGLQIASGSLDETIRIWNTQDGSLIRTLEGHKGGTYNIAYSPNGMQIASGGMDTMIRIWDVQSGKAIHVLGGHRGEVHSLAYSPNGMQIASGSDDSVCGMHKAAQLYVS